MVIGNGLIASTFINDYQKDKRFVIFASGVSNSNETNSNEFKKEENLLKKTLEENKNKHIVYFTSFIDPHKIKYIDHKINMENIIKTSNVFYTILKLPQVIGNGGNINNLLNYMVHNIKNNNVISIYSNVCRSLIDVEDVKKIIDILIKKWLDKNTYVIFPYIEKMLVKDIVYLISKELNIDPIINMIDSEIYDLPEKTPVVNSIMNHLNIISEGYTKKIIHKYVK